MTSRRSFSSRGHLLPIVIALSLVPFVSVDAASAARTSIQPVDVVPMPPVRVVLQEKQLQAIRIEKVAISSTIFVGRAQTTYTITLKNPNSRALEGSLEIPLLPEQRVTGFALDINGVLRAASSVPKDKAQTIFEDIERRGTDPGLLEKNEGNVYRLRIYPLAANGERTAQITVSQDLVGSPSGAALRLPLNFAQTLGQFALSVQSPTRITPTRGLAGAVVHAPDTQHKDYQLDLSAQNYQPSEWIEITANADNAPSEVWLQEQYQGQNYVLASLPIRADIALQAARAHPQRIDIFWDASTSAQTDTNTRAITLLETYLRQIQAQGTPPEVVVHLVRQNTEHWQPMTLRTPESLTALIQRLQGITYDGATRLDDLTPSANSQMILFFGDGLATYGERHLAWQGTISAPIFMFNTQTSNNFMALQRSADAHGGAWIDLTRGTAQEAIDIALTALTHRHAVIKRVSSASLVDILYPQRNLSNGVLQFAARSQERSHQVDIDIEDAQGQNQRLSVFSPKNLNLTQGQFAAQQWGQWRVDELSEDSNADTNAHQKQIEQLSTQLGLVNDRMSLMVLENASDYARYNVTPPPELSAEVEKIKANTLQKTAQEQNAHIEQVVKAFEDKRAWWEKSFPKSTPPKPKEDEKQRVRPTAIAAAVAPPMPVSRAVPPAAPVRHYNASSAADEIMSNGRVSSNNSTSIQLKKWEANAPYIKRFKEADDNDLYQVYLDERAQYRNSTAFYLDAAEVFFERKQDVLALRVLSNLAELNLDNRDVLRILSYRLMQAKRAPEAISFLKRVTQLAPNEPQSWRDLGLAYAATGATDEAIKHLWKVVSEPWHGRFPGIEQIALNELNAIAAQHKANTAMVDARLRQNLPVDLRVVLAWDTDNTDMDLWVTDPNGEKVYYGHRLSYQGGRISNDFTGGYGPEEFLLKNAKKGKYKVEAQFYGHRQQIISAATTLMMKLSTQFGTNRQKDEEVILRLSGNKEQVFVGEFTVR